MAMHRHNHESPDLSEHFGLKHVAKRPVQTVTSEWVQKGERPIQDMTVKEIKNLIIRNGSLTELFRSEWFNETFPARHIVHVAMLPNTTSAWHCHYKQNDLIICIRGQLRVGLYDDRLVSPTYQNTRVMHVSHLRSSILQVPPGVWHAIKNPSAEEAAYIVINDQPYHYENPDDWIIPSDSDLIPLKWD